MEGTKLPSSTSTSTSVRVWRDRKFSGRRRLPIRRLRLLVGLRASWWPFHFCFRVRQSYISWTMDRATSKAGRMGTSHNGFVGSCWTRGWSWNSGSISWSPKIRVSNWLSSTRELSRTGEVDFLLDSKLLSVESLYFRSNYGEWPSNFRMVASCGRIQGLQLSLRGGLTNSGLSPLYILLGEPMFSRPGVLDDPKWVLEGS